MFDPAVFREIVGRFASGVTVVTTHHDGVDFGMTASAMCSLSLAPCMVLVCVNRQAPTREAVRGSGVFTVNILNEDQADTAIRFATPQADKFAGLDLTRGDLGCPRLDGVLAWLECTVVDDIAGGTHSVFFGEVRTAEGRDGNPLAYFRGQFGRLYSSSDDPVAIALREHVLGSADSEPLNIERLADELGVRVPDVQRSMASLIADGVVAHRHGGGYRVVPLSEQSIDSTFDARCAIELGALELAFTRADGGPSAASLAQLREDMERTRPLIRNEHFTDVRAYARANAWFHETLAGLSGSQDLVDAYRRLSLPSVLVRALTSSSYASDALVEDHDRIVTALEQRDPDAAREAVRVHTKHTKEVHRRSLLQRS